MKLTERDEKIQFYRWRFYAIVIFLCLCFIGLVLRMVDLTVFDRDFLQKKGDARSLRVIKVPAYRGMITDRQGVPLAVSTPMNSVWINPQEFVSDKKSVDKLQGLLTLKADHVQSVLEKNKQREFVYLKRSVDPDLAQRVTAMNLPGVYLQKEYRRYYPDGAVTSHLIGFTNVDDRGQEGLELAYNQWLGGSPGEKMVVKDRKGNVVKVVDYKRQEEAGRDLSLSIDRRIQFLTYQVLKNTVDEFEAKAGSAIVLDVKTGEVLAMVNQPDYNPNNRAHYISDHYRNRAMTDTFEPGSTMKSFAVVSALDSQKYTPDSMLETSPGWFRIGRNVVRDEEHNYGRISLTDVLKKSSNVGIAKVTLSLPPEQLRGVLSRVGFSRKTASGFPGEASGYLVDYQRWPQIALSTLAFGYGVTVTPMQLASAYSVIASGGIKRPVSLLKVNKKVVGERVLDSRVSREVLSMLESVLAKDGTGKFARVRGYRVAGKTGTARVAIPGGYDRHRHISSFVGLAPVSNPRLVVLVVVFEPQKKHYYASLVAGPAFSKIMGGALRILNVPPDDVASLKQVIMGNVGVTS